MPTLLQLAFLLGVGRGAWPREESCQSTYLTSQLRQAAPVATHPAFHTHTHTNTHTHTHTRTHKSDVHLLLENILPIPFLISPSNSLAEGKGRLAHSTDEETEAESRGLCELCLHLTKLCPPPGACLPSPPGLGLPPQVFSPWVLCLPVLFLQRAQHWTLRLVSRVTVTACLPPSAQLRV